ncbi:transposase [Streptomyces ambofaciens]
MRLAGSAAVLRISKSTAHRRFLIWSRAGVWGRLHEAVLHRLDDAGLIDVTRVVLDTAHVRAKKCPYGFRQAMLISDGA